MRFRPGHVVLGLVGLTVGVLGVGALREATLSTHQPVPPGSEITVVVRAHIRGGEHSQTLAEMVEAQLHECRLEVTSDVVGPVTHLGEGEFRAVLAPSMDETNRRQFRGCLEDWKVDHLSLDVLELEPGEPDADDRD